MRATAESFLRRPLSLLLGTKASVRVLRELALHGNALTTTAIARRTGITDQSVRNTLKTILPTGVLDVFGQDRSSSYRLDVHHPIGHALLALFRAERERVEAIREAVASAAQGMTPSPLAVWLFGSVARGEDEPGSDLDLLLVVDGDETADREANRFRDLLADLEREHQITISVVPMSTSDVERMAGAGEPLWKELMRDAVAWHGGRPETLVRAHRRRARSARG